MPTLFVLGTADEQVPYVAQKHAAAAVHEALVLPIEGAGHWLLRDRPAQVVGAIRAPPEPAPRAWRRRPACHAREAAAKLASCPRATAPSSP
jgi:alpha-beta hydrolase superfamily lysophospholipase